MPRPDSLRARRMRAQIAQAAARLIAEHGLTDWASAKRKACRELGLPDHEALPANDEVEQALRDYNSLFRAAAQVATLKLQRSEALRWMEHLADWRPILTGAVAAGWATEHSEISLELEADEPKAVEMALVNAGIDYAVVAPRGQASPAPQLRAENAAGAVRLVILTTHQRRNRPRRDDEHRLTLPQLKALVALADDPAGAAQSTPSANPQRPTRNR